MGTKAEAYDLVAELRRLEFTTMQTAVVMGYSPQRVGQMLVELGLHKQRRFATVIAAIESLPAEVRLRLMAFRGQDFQIEDESKQTA
jgi:hypothetical protein